MHIIFGYISSWQIPILKIFKYFKLDVYYLHINAKTNNKKVKIADKLKRKGIYPLPIEFEKKILSNAGWNILFKDPDEFSYKKNKELVPDKFLRKYSDLFSIDENNTKKLRLLIQDFVYSRQLLISSRLGVWSALYPQKKIIYVSFNFKCFYMSDVNQNISKIIIPLDLFNYLIRIIDIRKILSQFLIIKNKKNDKFSNELNFEKIENKSIALITHKGITYGSEKGTLYEKTLYYSNDKNSCLNKYNILHFDYSNFSSPEKNLHWVCLNKIGTSKIKFFQKILAVSIKTFYLIRSWPTFLGWLFCIHQYSAYITYYEILKKFKKLKIALIDYDILCPKTLLLALEKHNVKTVATQERFIHTFCSSFANVFFDTYYVVSEYIASLIKKSKYNDVKDIIPVGFYRSDYLSLLKKNNIPEEISIARKNGKKILVILGYSPSSHWFSSYISLQSNWSSQISFLEDIIKLSKNLKNTFIILRYKALENPFGGNEHFKDILDKVHKSENIVLSENYNEPNYSYKLCANADLIIAKHTSLADECLSNEIPVLFYDYTHNMKQMMSVVFDYSPSGLMCYNFVELLEKSRSLLFNNSSNLKKEITKLKETIYYVKEKGNTKNKIIGQLENLISST